MNKLISAIFSLTIVLVVVKAEDKIVNVELTGFCELGAAPVGPGGSWQTVEKNVKKVCPPGSSCRKGACNCDDVNGFVMSASVDSKGERVCKRVAGQKCRTSDECFYEVDCVNGVCTCDKSKTDNYCVDRKNDVYIMA